MLPYYQGDNSSMINILTPALLMIAICNPFQLHYTFQKALLFQEPLLVVGAFYLLFIVVIIYVRLDFSITKVKFKEGADKLSWWCAGLVVVGLCVFFGG